MNKTLEKQCFPHGAGKGNRPARPTETTGGASRQERERRKHFANNE
jgi:hypothetical protein